MPKFRVTFEATYRTQIVVEAENEDAVYERIEEDMDFADDFKGNPESAEVLCVTPLKEEQ